MLKILGKISPWKSGEALGGAAQGGGRATALVGVKKRADVTLNDMAYWYGGEELMVGLDGFSGLSSLYHSITGDWHPS